MQALLFGTEITIIEGKLKNVGQQQFSLFLLGATFFHKCINLHFAAKFFKEFLSLFVYKAMK